MNNDNLVSVYKRNNLKNTPPSLSGGQMSNIAIIHILISCQYSNRNCAYKQRSNRYESNQAGFQFSFNCILFV